MEADGEDLENIFEEYQNEDEAENTENKTANETPGAVKIAAPKRVVRNPRLKFNADRLCGERGIPVLVDHFKHVKFKGSGHEVENLDKLLTKLEHWTHRLFPSMKFEDCLTHIEKLGKKRQVQCCLRKIRLDMPILNKDFEKGDEDDNVRRNEDAEEEEPEEINAFDRLLGESGERSSINVNASTSENVSNSSSFYSSPMPNDIVGHVLGSSFGSSLNDEQKERMERNRMLAAERRKAKLAAMEQNNLRPESEDLEIISENTLSEQNSFDKLLHSSENNEGRNNSGLKTNQDFDKNMIKSSDLKCDNSEELGLDDLMDLVDEEDPVSDRNATMSPSEKAESISNNVNEVNTFPSEDTENFKNFDSVSKNTKHNFSSSPEFSSAENLNTESSLDLICKTSVNSKIDTNTDYFVNDAPNNVNNVVKNGDFISLDCEDKNSYFHVNNTKQTNKSPSNNTEDFKNFDNVSESAKSKILLSPKSLQKSPEENLNMESSLDLISESSMDSELSAKPSCSMKDASVIDENVIRENENFNSMDCEDQDS